MCIRPLLSRTGYGSTPLPIVCLVSKRQSSLSGRQLPQTKRLNSTPFSGDGPTLYWSQGGVRSKGASGRLLTHQEAQPGCAAAAQISEHATAGRDALARPASLGSLPEISCFALRGCRHARSHIEAISRVWEVDLPTSRSPHDPPSA